MSKGYEARKRIIVDYSNTKGQKPSFKRRNKKQKTKRSK